MPYRALLFLLLLAVGGCATKLAAPEPPAPRVEQPATPASVIQIAFHGSMETLQRTLEKALPPSPLIHVDDFLEQINGGADNEGGASVGYHVERDSPALSVKDGRLSATLGVRYSLIARARPTKVAANIPVIGGLLGKLPSPPVKGSCGRDGESMRRMQVTMSGNGTLAPDWTPALTLRLDDVVPLDPCKVVLPVISVQDKIAGRARETLAAKAEQLNARAAIALPVRKAAEELWALAWQPIVLDEGIWLLLQPTKVGLFAPRFEVGGAYASASITAAPRVVLGTPPEIPTPALPILTTADPGNTFFVALPVQAQYASLEQRVANALGPEGVVYRTEGHQVRVSDVRVYGYGPKALAKARIVGDLGFLQTFDLTGYLAGTPHYDAVTRRVSFPDLEFDVETANLLIKVANWLKHDELRNQLRTKLVIDTEDLVVKARTKLTEATNRKLGPILLKGTFNDVRLLGIRANPSESSFILDTLMQGTLTATLQ